MITLLMFAIINFIKLTLISFWQLEFSKILHLWKREHSYLDQFHVSEKGHSIKFSTENSPFLYDKLTYLGNPIFSSFFPVTAPFLQSGVVAATRLAEKKAYQLQWHVKGAGKLIVFYFSMGTNRVKHSYFRC